MTGSGLVGAQQIAHEDADVTLPRGEAMAAGRLPEGIVRQGSHKSIGLRSRLCHLQASKPLLDAQVAREQFHVLQVRRRMVAGGEVDA